MVIVKIDNHPFQMEVDTEATLSVISESTYHKVWGDKAPQPKESKVKLKHTQGRRYQ